MHSCVMISWHILCPGMSFCACIRGSVCAIVLMSYFHALLSPCASDRAGSDFLLPNRSSAIIKNKKIGMLFTLLACSSIRRLLVKAQSDSVNNIVNFPCVQNSAPRFNCLVHRGTDQLHQIVYLPFPSASTLSALPEACEKVCVELYPPPRKCQVLTVFILV